MSSDLLTEDEIGVERAFEVRVRDLKTSKQRSFSIYRKTETDHKKTSLEDLKSLLLTAIKEVEK